MIILDDNWTVKEDTACWILEYKHEGAINPKTGKPKISLQTFYCANLKHALATYLDESLKGSTEIQDVLNSIREVSNTIETMVLDAKTCGNQVLPEEKIENL